MDLAIAADGSVVLVGQKDENSSGNDFAIARLTPTGQPDLAFGIAGKQTIDFDGGDDRIYGVAIQSDGSIVVAGGTSSSPDFAVVRLTPSGQLDASFGDSGRRMIAFPSSDYNQPRGIAIQSDGKIVIAGISVQQGGSYFDFAVARLDPLGDLDPTFGNLGTTTLSLSGGYSYDELAAVAMRTDGSIVLVGWSSDQGIEVAMLTPSGSIDLAFGAAGRTTVDIGYDRATSVVIQSDGAIVVGGGSKVIRLTASGQIDPSYGIDGQKTFDSPGSVNEITIQADGRVIAAGGSYDETNLSKFALSRLSVTGQFDNSFGSNGVVTTEFLASRSSDTPGASTVLPDGKILVAGRSFTGSSEFFVSRYLTNGALDISFGVDGKVYFDFPSTLPNGRPITVTAIAVGGDESIAIAGYFTVDRGILGSEYDIAVVRLSSTGQLNQSFGNNGVAIFGYDSTDDFPLELNINSDGSILVSAYAASFIEYDAWREFISETYLSPGGEVTPFYFVSKVFFAIPSAIQADGRYFMMNAITNAVTGSDIAVTRYNKDRSVDTSFGDAGTASIDFGSLYDNVISSQIPKTASISLQPDGKIVVVGGSVQGDTGYDVVLARLEGYGKSIVGTAGNDTIQVDPGTQPGTWKTTINSVVTDNITVDGELYVAGLGGDDAFIVNASLTGGLVLAGQAGSDTYDINFGNLAGKVSIAEDGSTGTDSITVFGTAGDDVIFKDDTKITLGNPVTETITTIGIETRTIHGGTGNDTITDPGSDTFLYGDEGNDTIIINATTGSGVTADGGNGSDTYNLVSGALQGPVTILDSGVSGLGVVDNVALIGTPNVDTLVQTSSGFVLNGTTINIGTGLETATVDGGGGDDQQIVEGTPPIPQIQVVTAFNNAPVFVSLNSFTVVGSTTAVGLVQATDADLPAQTLSFSVSGGVDAGQFLITTNGALSFQVAPDFELPTDENGDNVYLVEVIVADGAGGYRTQSLSVRVTSASIPPVVGIAGPTSGVRGQARQFTLTASDANPLDASVGFEYRVDWGDGSPIQIIGRTAGNGAGVAVEHTYLRAGNYVANVVAKDMGGLVSETKLYSIAIALWQMQPDPARPGKHVLVIGGSDGDDRITVKPYRNQDDFVRVRINEVDYDIRRQQVFGPNVDSILVYAQAGDDRVELDNNLDIPSILDGGLGDDRLIAGSGDSVMLGGEGNDRLEGGSGRDILIGGRGADRIEGNAGDDILIAGYTAFDRRYAALIAILNEWSSSRTYAMRVENLSASWLKGSGPGVTVFDDNDVDRLEGSSGKDWFFANLMLDSGAGDTATKKDKIDDLGNGEFWHDIHFGRDP